MPEPGQGQGDDEEMHRLSDGTRAAQFAGSPRLGKWRGVIRATSATAVVVATVGCASSGSTNSPQPVATAQMGVATGVADLITVNDARAMGYRVDWRLTTTTSDGGGFKLMTAQGDSLFLVDQRNILGRIRREDGARLWRVAISNPMSGIQGLTYLPYLERLFVTIGGDMLVLDTDTGSPIARQNLGQIAATAPQVYGGMFVYGSGNGQLVWHSFEVGQQWKAYQISRSLQLAPVLVNDTVVAIGDDGLVMALDAGGAVQIWSKLLGAPVVAPPAANDRAVFVAGKDQRLWAIDIADGRTRWSYLTESKLLEPPTLAGNRIYQQIPSEGLVCFDANARSAPEGVVIWRAPAVRGNVLTEADDQLLVWDEKDRRMSILDSAHGSIVKTIDLPGVEQMLVTSRRSGEIYAAGGDGRVLRLVPRH